MTASEAAREAAWLEQTQSRRPLPRTPAQAAWDSRADDDDPAIQTARRTRLLTALDES